MNATGAGHPLIPVGTGASKWPTITEHLVLRHRFDLGQPGRRRVGEGDDRRRREATPGGSSQEQVKPDGPPGCSAALGEPRA